MTDNTNYTQAQNALARASGSVVERAQVYATLAVADVLKEILDAMPGVEQPAVATDATIAYIQSILQSEPSAVRARAAIEEVLGL